MNSAAIARLLPEVFRRTCRPGTAVAALCEVMADLQDPIERTLDRLDAAFDPHRADDAFVPLLARWVDLDRLLAAPGGAGHAPIPTLPSGHGRLRELVAAAADLAQLRGTALGLRTFLATATGCAGIAIEEGAPEPGGTPRPFHFVVRAPAEVRPLETLIRTIIAMEKPAHATCNITFEPAGRGD